MIPLFLAPLLTSLASSGLSVLAGAIEAKGKEVIEEKLGIKIPDKVEDLTPELLQQLKIKEMEHEEFLVDAQIRKAEVDLRAETNAQDNVSKRWTADMSSDSKLAKNIRPITLIYLLLVVSFFAFLSGVSSFTAPDVYIDLFAELLKLAFAAYFVGRSVEKGIEITGKYKQKREDKE